jgi:hypothetical protein
LLLIVPLAAVINFAYYVQKGTKPELHLRAIGWNVITNDAGEVYVSVSRHTDDAGLRELQSINKLVELEIVWANVTDAGLVHVGGLKDLETLNLAIPSTDAGLARLHGLTKLNWIALQGTKVTPIGINALQKALPKCTIYRNCFPCGAGKFGA